MKKLNIIPAMIEIRPTKMLKGQIGLFALRKLTKNFIISDASKISEKFYSWDIFEKLDRETKKKVEDFSILTEQGFYAPEDFNYLSIPWNMNHSCNYNVGFDKNGNLVTVRPIKKNEELTWDYGLGVSYPKYMMKCQCKSKNCRKIITGNDWKNSDFFKKNKQYILRDLLN